MAAEVVVDVVALSLGRLPAEEFEELEGYFAGAVEFGTRDPLCLPLKGGGFKVSLFGVPEKSLIFGGGFWEI